MTSRFSPTLRFPSTLEIYLEISWSSGMYNPIHPSSRYCTCSILENWNGEIYKPWRLEAGGMFDVVTLWALVSDYSVWGTDWGETYCLNSKKLRPGNLGWLGEEAALLSFNNFGQPWTLRGDPRHRNFIYFVVRTWGEGYPPTRVQMKAFMVWYVSSEDESIASPFLPSKNYLKDVWPLLKTF